MSDDEMATIKIVGDQSRPGFEVNIYWSGLRDNPKLLNDIGWLEIKGYVVTSPDRKAWYLSLRGQRIYDDVQRASTDSDPARLEDGD